MAKTKKVKRAKPQLKLAMRRHIEAHGGEWRYREKCREAGLAEHFHKSSQDIETECELFLRQEQARQREAKLYRHPKRFLVDVCLGQLKAEELQRQQWRDVAAALGSTCDHDTERERLLAFVLHLHAVSDLAFGTKYLSGNGIKYLQALVQIFRNSDAWLRPIDKWKPATHNVEKQFSSLLRYLFALHPVPKFFDQAWFDTTPRGEQHRRWYLHVARGHNIRFADTPVPLTKKMAHYMMEAPEHSGIDAAIRWGQVLALGGEANLADAVLSSRIATQFSDNEFWLSVIRFFVEYPLFDRQHVAPAIDYLHNQKFELRHTLDADRRRACLPPAQPNLSMHGRSPDALLAQVERWHRQLMRQKHVSPVLFPGSGIAAFRHEVGPGPDEIWHIRELASAVELREEGRLLKHCVLSYAASCAAGNNSIWTMEVEMPGGTIEKRQTIQVTKAGHIVQCRGKLNRLPNAREINILQRWAQLARLKISGAPGR
jgi:PcfJ-like protein